MVRYLFHSTQLTSRCVSAKELWAFRKACQRQFARFSEESERKDAHAAEKINRKKA